MSRLFSLAAICAALGTFAGCREAESARPLTSAPRVRVAQPSHQAVTDYAYFTGRLESPEAVNVQPRVTGYLVSVDFESGAQVKKDQQLFLIDPRPYQAALDVAKGQVDLAQAQLKLAQADYQRALQVARTPGAISQQEIDKNAAAQGEAEAQVAAAKANEESAQLNLEFTRIISPIDGRVGRNLLTVGNLIKQDNTLLTTVVSEDPMFAYFDVDELTMLRIERLIRDGKVSANREETMPVDMGLADEPGEYPHQGAINFVNNRVDPSTGTLQVRGEFHNPPLNDHGVRLLKPGMFVRIRLPIGNPYEGLVVPQAAIGSDQGSKYLLLVNQDNMVEYCPIALGPQLPGGLQVVSSAPPSNPDDAGAATDLITGSEASAKAAVPLTPDSWVIVAGLQRVHPGMTVAPQRVGGAPAGGLQDGAAK